MYFINVFSIALATCVYSTNASFGFGGTYEFLYEDQNGQFDNRSFDNDIEIKSKWIQQPLDHFSCNDQRTWQMRYFEALDFWKPGGPVYVFIGGEGEANPIFLRTGMIYELAKETNGAMFLSEHRYYGKSKPFPNLNKDTLEYLSSTQGLVDLAKLITEIKRLPQFRTSKVVVIGGSYPGNLAAWMRLKFPNLVDAALASSAPVLAKKDFHEYIETVQDVFKKYGTPTCYSKIRSSFERYHQLLQTNNGIIQLKKENKICHNTDMTRPKTQQMFFMSKSSPLMHAVQYGSPESIKQICLKITALLINT
ncbi:putative serine protease K12H4.7 [Anticarsia gemmatalis]|uniref:putative serine protease K12H4.7 n=1 Tax=Anticarsia gemmatalis TaxID=129554 RepID=UPI003F76157B